MEQRTRAAVCNPNLHQGQTVTKECEAAAMSRTKSICERKAGLFVLAACGSLFALPASPLAQTPPTGEPGAPPEVMEPPTENPTPPPYQPKEPFSKELKERDGVLEPPRGVDPEIQKDVPEDFKERMPVIPPPGGPGGNPDVQPK
jgi:hypothetical protein